LQTTQETGAGWRQQLVQTDSSCVDGTTIAESGVGQTVGITITRPPGAYWFMVRAVQGTDEIYTNCVQVTVQDVAATLKVDGHSDTATFLPGQSVALYVDGFTPGAKLT
ncbi:MAG TPA: hypothetical protein PLV68_16125, partial [Ilumatobacteraceae bacterium]|nr:hypothetical protein [Ilumatobacteraceae bacterium]